MNEPTTTALVAAQMTAMQVCEQMPRLTQMGDALAKSGILGQITASTGAVVAMTCAQEGISLVQFKAKYHIMQDGNLAVKSRYLHAEFRRRGGKIHINAINDKECDLTFSYDGEILRYRVTLQQFIDNGVAMGKNGVMKANWKAYPMDMLFNRCCATAIRKLCPEADGGLYAEEELQDRASSPFANAGGETRTLSPEEVTSRIMASTATQTPAEPATPAAPTTPAAPAAPTDIITPDNYDVCPVPGKLFGKAWRDMRDDTLAHVLKAKSDKYPELTDKHRAAIAAVFQEREAEEAAAAEEGK